MLQAQEKGTRLIDEDGLFSLVAAAPEAGPAAASPATKPSELRPGSFYGGKASTGTGDQARKAALASSSLAASGTLWSCCHYEFDKGTSTADVGLGTMPIFC